EEEERRGAGGGGIVGEETPQDGIADQEEADDDGSQKQPPDKKNQECPQQPRSLHAISPAVPSSPDVHLRQAHDPEKCAAVFGKARPRARPEGSCSNKKLKRNDDSKKSHRRYEQLVLQYRINRCILAVQRKP